MAVSIKWFILVAFLIVIIAKNINCVEKRSRGGCAICRKTYQCEEFQDIESYQSDIQHCFGVTEPRSSHICETCRRAIQSFRSTGYQKESQLRISMDDG